LGPVPSRATGLRSILSLHLSTSCRLASISVRDTVSQEHGRRVERLLTLKRLEAVSHTIELMSPDVLVVVIQLAPWDNVCLTGALSNSPATADVPDLTRSESMTVQVDTPGSSLLPGQISDRRGCTLVSKHANLKNEHSCPNSRRLSHFA